MMKMKKKAKKTESTNKFSVEKLLKKDNKTVIEFVDGIINANEKQSTLKQLIDYLDNSLLDRDVGKTGPKLKEQLKQRLANNGTAIKEYKLEDLIWWKGTEAQLEYLMALLIKENLIDSTQYNERFSLIAKHFKNTDGNKFKNKQASQAVRNLRGEKPPGAEKLEKIVANTRSK